MTYRLTFSQLTGLAICGLAFWLPGSTQAQNSLSYNFSQNQTHLTAIVESSQNINSSHWSYAGPLDNKDNCSNRKFPDIPADLKGRTEVIKSGNKKARAEISVSSANNNKYYCFIIEGYPVPRQLDYNPPTIELGKDGNLLKGRDVYQSPYAGPTTINSKSWQAAVFDNQLSGANYRCNANNGALKFRPVSSKLTYVSQYSWGNTNHLSYNVPGLTSEDIEFFNGLKDAVYTTKETDPALIPFIADDWNDQFTDNIHLCHRVSDNKGNQGYKLMRLDLGGPVIKLEIDGQSIRASSPAVDLDDSTWKYLATDQRSIRSTCDLLTNLTQPTGQSAVVDQAIDGHYYCFVVLDKQGNFGRAWIRAELDETGPPPETETNNDPQPATNPDNTRQQNQQLTDTVPVPSQDDGPEPIDGQAAEVGEADPAPGNDTEAPATEAETTPVESEMTPESQPTSQPKPAATNEPTTEDEIPTDAGLAWPVIVAFAGVLVVGIGGWLILKNQKTKQAIGDHKDEKQDQ